MIGEVSNLNEQIEKYGEPQVTSDDPNERKLARKLRIERRWEVIQRQTMTADQATAEEEEAKTEVQLQVQKSADLLEKFIREGEEYITNVRVANDAREIDRREVEGIGKEKIIEQLENEATAAQNMFHEIAEKWSDIQQYNDPLHMHEDIMSQKDKCDLLITQKDGIIAMLKDELKKAEKNYTKDQRKQMEDINTLAQRIEKQITFMRSAYQKEFELIEDVILAERQNLIDSNNKKWDELYKKRDQQEISNSDKKFQQLEKFDDKMTELRIDFQEKFRETKIKLEGDIEYLQRELERIKALALLNSEKLDYNYQILRKREDENIIIKSQQKRRMNKLQDVINDLRKKSTDYETSTNNLIKKLTDDIKKLHRNILEVEAKADHFAKVNDEKFHEVWEMNRKNCQLVLKKILETDKILHEQQMGVSWIPPPHNIINKTNLPSYREALAVLENVPSVTAEATKSQSSISTVSSKMKKVETAQVGVSMEIVRPTMASELLNVNPMYRRLLKYLLTHVSDKSGFLSEKRLNTILKDYEDDQKTLVRLDNVFESLGIHKREDIDLLVTYFLPYTHCPKCASMDLAKQPSMLSRFTSQLSNLSSAFSRVDTEHMDILELEQAFNAIQQPSDLIEEVVLELASTDDLFDERYIKEEDSLEIPCGADQSEDYYTEIKEKKVAKKKTYIAEEKLLCQYNHPLVISSIYILRGLREFVAAYYEASKGLPTTRERLERKRITVSRKVSSADIKFYWEKFKEVYNEDRVRIWDALLEGLRKYHEILKDRRTLCEDVVDLRRQNEELKRLLSNYMDHGEYLKPPCAVEQDNCLNTTQPPYTKSK